MGEDVEGENKVEEKFSEEEQVWRAEKRQCNKIL